MAFNHKFALELSEKVTLANGNKKHKAIGTVSIPAPILADFGIQAVQAVYTADDQKADPVKVAGQPAFENGIPLYEDGKMDWLQQAVVFRISATSRNRFVKGALKPGATLAEDFEALTADTARTGEALALRREARVSFEAYLQKLAKKAGTVQVLGDLFFSSNKVLASAGEKYVEALSKYAVAWVGTLTNEQKVRFAPKITELQESINNATSNTDLDDDLA